MASQVSRTMLRPGNTQIPARELETLPSFPLPRVRLPLERVSPEMAAHLIDELMKAIEEQAEVKLPTTGRSNDTKSEGCSPYDVPSLPELRGFLGTNQQASARPRSIAIYSTSLSLPQEINENTSQASMVKPLPLNFSRVHRSVPSTTTLHRSDANFRKRGSRYILVDHAPHRIGSQESNTNASNANKPQKFPIRIDSIAKIQQQRDLLPPPSCTSRRHSTDANQSYWSLSDSASTHPDFPLSSQRDNKKWMGLKTGSHGIQQNSAGPGQVDDKQPKTKSSALSKSRSFFSHFKYEMFPTPLFYIPEMSILPAQGDFANSRRSTNDSLPKTKSIRQNDTTDTKSCDVSIHSQEKTQQQASQDDLNLPVAHPSRLPSKTSHANNKTISPQKQSSERPESLLPHLGWDTTRTPADPKDFQDVEGWLANTYTGVYSPTAPLSPFCSEKGITAPGSPVQSNSLSIPIGGHYSSKDEGIKMQSRIISWVDLEGCTTEFVQSLQVLGTVNGLEPESASEIVADEIGSSILSTPTSKYMDNVFDESLKSSSLGVVSIRDGSSIGDRRSSSKFSSKSPPKFALSTCNSAQPPNAAATLGPGVTPESSLGANRPKPQIAPLIIPPTPYATFRPSSTKPQSKNSLPHVPNLTTTSLRDSPNTTTVNRPEKNGFPDEDSPTIPVALSIPLPHRSSRRSKKAVESPQQAKAPKVALSNYEGEYDAPIPAPPIPTRLRPITPPQTELFAPALGLSLRISRHYVSQTKSEWLIKSTPSALLTCFSTAVNANLCSERKLDFWNPNGQHVFSFHKAAGKVRVGETKDGKVLFVVKEGFNDGEWSITHNAAAAAASGREEEDGVMWRARVTDVDEGCEVLVSRGDFEVGKITAEIGKLRNTYTVAVNPQMNYCIMAALTTVFDEWRVDEGFY